MANIRIDPETMEVRVREYQHEAEQVGQIIGDMDRLLSQLQTEWEGEASLAYANRYGELRPGFLRAQELVNEIATALHNTAQAMREQDASIAAGFR